MSIKYLLEKLDEQLTKRRECESRLASNPDYLALQEAEEKWDEVKWDLLDRLKVGKSKLARSGRLVTAMRVETSNLDKASLEAFLQQNGKSLSDFQVGGSYWKIVTKK